MMPGYPNDSSDVVKQKRADATYHKRVELLARAGRLSGADIRAMAILTRCVTNPDNLMSDDQIIVADAFLSRLGL